MALQYLDSQRIARPELAEWLTAMGDLYEKKLWQQLTLEIEKFIALPIVKTSDVLIPLYQNFITDFETNMNPLKLAQIAVIVSRQYSDKEAAINYLEGIIVKLGNDMVRIQGPLIYVNMQIAAFNLERGKLKECKKLLNQWENSIKSMADVDPTVYASFYWESCRYHKCRQEFVEFYKNALLFLSYSSLESLSESFKLDFVFDLSLAALLGDNIYNFGELLTHAIINCLLGTNVEWIYHVLQAFNTGNLALYQELCRVHSAALNAQPALIANEKKLMEKINILCLMEIIISRPSEDRTIPLSIISERTRLSIEDVEYLLMKSLSSHLIEGFIDQVEGTVYVSWVQPRVLGLPQIKLLRDHLKSWEGKIHSTLLTVEAEVPDLASS